MATLIPITNREINGEVFQTVNARDLHAFLEVGRDFSNWIKVQVRRAGLVEGEDFIKLAQKGELSATGQTLTDYFLTIDSAKHVGMMSATDPGKKLRGFFIQIEKDYRNAQFDRVVKGTIFDEIRNGIFDNCYEAVVANERYELYKIVLRTSKRETLENFSVDLEQEMEDIAEMAFQDQARSPLYRLERALDATRLKVKTLDYGIKARQAEARVPSVNIHKAKLTLQ